MLENLWYDLVVCSRLCNMTWRFAGDVWHDLVVCCSLEDVWHELVVCFERVA
jgi:hypothetical protein